MWGGGDVAYYVVALLNHVVVARIPRMTRYATLLELRDTMLVPVSLRLASHELVYTDLRTNSQQAFR